MGYRSFLILIGFFAAGSGARAETPDFERGYVAGIESCNQNSFWKCSLTSDFFAKCGKRFPANGHAYATGETKAAALEKLVAAWGAIPSCQEKVLDPGAVRCDDVLRDDFSRASGPKR